MYKYKVFQNIFVTFKVQLRQEKSLGTKSIDKNEIKNNYDIITNFHDWPTRAAV